MALSTRGVKGFKWNSSLLSGDFDALRRYRDNYDNIMWESRDDAVRSGDQRQDDAGRGAEDEQGHCPVQVSPSIGSRSACC